MPEKSLKITRINNSSSFQFIKSKDYSKNRYENRKDWWNNLGFTLKQSDICEINFDKFDLTIGESFLKGFLTWVEYNTLCDTFCDWKEKERTWIQTCSKLTKNEFNYKEIVKSIINQQRNVTIGVITTKNYGSGYNDFQTILAPNSEYFKRLNNQVELKTENLDFTKEQAKFQETLNDFIAAQDIDMIAIIRGGGFLSLPILDDISIAKIISAAQKPIILGVGHIENKTLCDAYVSCCFGTPSLAAVGIRDAFLPSIC